MVDRIRMGALKLRRQRKTKGGWREGGEPPRRKQAFMNTASKLRPRVHTNGPRKMARYGALNILQTPIYYKKSQKNL
jgi:hypothetical protein